MAKFKFNILTGENAQEKYDAIITKEPFTFYLLQTGVGYLGEKKLFDSASLNDNRIEMTAKFFRAVKAHSITQEDLDNEAISKPEGTAVGDTGMLFTADNNETDDGDEVLYFIPVTIETPETTDTIDPNNPDSKLPTASAVINYVVSEMSDKVSFEIDGEQGVQTPDGGIAFPSLYSENEVRVGTWIDGKPIYRRVVTGTTPSATFVVNWMDITSWNIDAVIDIKGIIVPAPNSAYAFNTTDDGSWKVITVIQEGVIQVYVSRSLEYNKPMFVIVEYTKTTD